LPVDRLKQHLEFDLQRLGWEKPNEPQHVLWRDRSVSLTSGATMATGERSIFLLRRSAKMIPSFADELATCKSGDPRSRSTVKFPVWTAWFNARSVVRISTTSTSGGGTVSAGDATADGT
jgi:hypothetical protein